VEGWLGCLLCLGGSDRPCNTCIALPCICITFPQRFSLIHLHKRHRQPHTFQQAPPATSPMLDMLRCQRLVLRPPHTLVPSLVQPKANIGCSGIVRFAGGNLMVIQSHH